MIGIKKGIKKRITDKLIMSDAKRLSREELEEYYLECETQPDIKRKGIFNMCFILGIIAVIFGMLFITNATLYDNSEYDNLRAISKEMCNIHEYGNLKMFYITSGLIEIECYDGSIQIIV